ncbi:hypothetical protein Tco_0876578 [Tanacetum coccineum]|uniref:Uncharacterized protein n=1 Tax=Tanacetum coccineum TaxID=301880 RepID=A0ABQ5BVF6_9ASTR
MDDPSITIEEYIRLEKEKARRRGKVYNWETATYGKIWDNKDVYDLGSIETEFPAIVFNDTLTSEVALSCEPTVSSLNNDEIDFRISFDESDDEDCTILENEKNYLSTANHDQATRIQSLEAELAKKDSALTYAERMLAEGAKDHEKLTAQLGHAKIENFDCIRKLLPTVIMAILHEVENFDPFSDKKLYPMYDKLFEKKYPYVEKISKGYRHSVADLLKVHPDLIPSTGTSTPTISKALGGSGAPPKKKT